MSLCSSVLFKNFSVPEKSGYVYAYQRNKRHLLTTVNSVAAKNDLYVFSAKATLDGRENDELEKVFAELEGFTKPIIERVITTSHLDIKSSREFGALCEFFAFLHTRNLAYRQEQKNLAMIIHKMQLKIMAKDPESFRETVRKATKKLTRMI